jgi:hypothetical protein
VRVIAAVALGLAAAPAAEARSFVIEARGFSDRQGVVQRIGDFRPPRGESLGAAIRAFGEPSSRSGGGNSCSVRWRPLGVRILFANFGGEDACDPSGGQAQRAFVSGDRRWHTARGLHIGARLQRLRQLYPNARRNAGGGFPLVTSFSPFGTGGRYTVLGARVRGGRVTGFSMFIGGAGE